MFHMYVLVTTPKYVGNPARKVLKRQLVDLAFETEDAREVARRRLFELGLNVMIDREKYFRQLTDAMGERFFTCWSLLSSRQKQDYERYLGSLDYTVGERGQDAQH